MVSYTCTLSARRSDVAVMARLVEQGKVRFLGLSEAGPATPNPRELVTAETAEPGTEPTRNQGLMGRLPPADWRVKRNLPDREGAEC
jgi:hypothetical protein